MSQERLVSKRIWTSESVSKLSNNAQLVLHGLIETADDHGRGRGSAHSVKLTLGTIQGTIEEFQTWLDEIANQDIAKFYVVDGSTFYYFPKWLKYQNLRYVSRSMIPAPEDNNRESDRSGQDQEKSARFGKYRP